MPEYILPEMSEPEFQALPEIVQGYIQAMFFTNQSSIAMTEFHEPESQRLIREGLSDGDLPQDAGFLDLHPDSLKEIITDCGTFHVEARALLRQAYDKEGYDAERAGMDFWYTRNGHGVGFWERPELGDELGDALTEVAKRFGEVNPWFSEADPNSPTGYGWVHHAM